MLPFVVTFRSGVPAYEEVLYAVRRALISGGLRPGDEFPSVRVLSQELRINPNTAHKIVGRLIAEGILAVRPGIGTVVTSARSTSPAQRRQLLGDAVERLVVNAKMLGLKREEVEAALRAHWAGPSRKRA
jgi:GntR family transcriptional regulator